MYIVDEVFECRGSIYCFQACFDSIRHLYTVVSTFPDLEYAEYWSYIYPDFRQHYVHVYKLKEG